MTREGCVCCPYPLLAIPCFLSFVALCLTYNAAFNCNFYGITYFDTTESRSATLGIGLWTVESPSFATANDDFYDYDFYSSYCAGYSQYSSFQQLTTDDLDGAMIAARAFGMMTSIVSLICFILITIPSCVSFGDHDQFTKIVAGILIFLGTFTMLTLVALASDICKSADSCTLQGAGIVAIVASMLWFVCAGLMFVVMKRPRAMREDPDERASYAVGEPAATAAVPVHAPVEQKEIRTIQNADGSTTVTTTTSVTNADGSKSVTTTTEVTPGVTQSEVTSAKVIP